MRGYAFTGIEYTTCINIVKYSQIPSFYGSTVSYNRSMQIKRLWAWLAGGMAFLPSIAFAQGVPLDVYIVRFGGFINKFVIPLVVALAFVFFVYNAIRYFVIGGANSESQQKARMLALWGVLAFVFIVSMWGIVNVLVSSFGIGQNRAFCPDYNPNCGVNYADIQVGN
jgi:hypothetical protein